MIEYVRKPIKIMDVPIDNLDLKETVDLIDKYVVEFDDIRCRIVNVLDPAKIMMAQNNDEVMKFLQKSDLNIPGSMSVVFASKLLKKPLKSFTTSYDLMMEVIKMCHEKDYCICFFGGYPGVAELSKRRVEKDFKGIKVTGAYHGYFPPDYDEVIYEEINIKAPDVLFIDLESPKMERWVTTYLDDMYCGAIVTVEGCFDILSGRIKGAPKSMRSMGLEWFYNLFTHPYRNKGALPQFMSRVMEERKRVI